MEQRLEVRTWLSAADVDFLRAFARANGFRNTCAGTVRFAVRELAQRLRRADDQEGASVQSDHGMGAKTRA